MLNRLLVFIEIPRKPNLRNVALMKTIFKKDLNILNMSIENESLMAKRRIPPIFRLTMKNGTKIEQIYNHPQIQEIVMEELISALKEGIDRKKNSISLFQIGDSEFEIELTRDQWGKSINNALDYYCDKEDYRRCAQLRDMLSKL